MDWTTKESGFDSQQETAIILFFTLSRLILGPTQSPVQWVPGTLSLGLKQPMCEVKDNHLGLFVTIVINLWLT